MDNTEDFIMAQRIQVNKYGHWTDTLPQNILRNQMFRLLDEDGRVIPFPDGRMSQFASGDAHVTSLGKVAVNYEVRITF